MQLKILEMVEDNNPLVSINVITYNSSKFVLETLESAKAQTYQNIELIVSDDCSTDNTVDICREWIEKNKDRFVRTELITVEKNTGIAANCNRAVKASKGEWIKGIAGDDILMENCIEINIDNSYNKEMLISDMILFDSNREFVRNNPIDFDIFCKLSSKKRTKLYARTSFFCNIPTLFLKSSVYNTIGLYDESTPYLEDVPFLLKAFKSNIKIGYINEILVKYRLGGISNQNSLSFQKILIKAFFKYRRSELFIFNIVDLLLIIDYCMLFILTIKTNEHNLIYKIYISRYNLIRRITNKLSYKI